MSVTRARARADALDSRDSTPSRYPALSEGMPLPRARIEKEVLKEALADATKARETFGWAPKVSLAEGMAVVYTDAVARLRASAAGPGRL